MSGLMRDPKISLIIDEKWRSAVLPVDDLEINLDFIPNEGTFFVNKLESARLDYVQLK
jgi:hypothetical protein